ncbi:hypothetical protein DRW41_03920 [Neobacillus piezotolerans]|uniref:6-bladed beta-propeller n=1 Tax=Neobacillus piezotolerans TaxID=2259171 RepID=A0A3D8GWA4_9BACI|nr:hypothetical protein [Neobacillus piezotolerans]RDU38715.1 hypothetical protein DRW41_03920 [Neobacillus piezotolerans]
MNYKMNPIADLKNDFNGYTLASVTLGSSGEICILGVNEVPARIGGMFPPVQTKTSHNYKVIILGKEYKQEVKIKKQKWNYHFIQIIDENHILLACARAELYENGEYDRNAKVFDFEGNLIREFLLGDGIQDLYVTRENKIWTSYFDEGVFGNYGWDNPIGAYGLRAWDSDGKEIYTYRNDDPHFISDCYALNVAGEEDVWFYFYTEFELGRYKNGKLEYFQPDVEGSDGFIVYKEYFLFRGDYDDRDQYILYKVGPGNRLNKVTILTLADETDNLLTPSLLSCRGAEMLFVSDNKVYVLHLKDLLRERGYLES